VHEHSFEGSVEYPQGHGCVAFSFLGYDPFPLSATTAGEKIKSYRRKSGLSIKKLARIIGIDPA
jgi:hypothetical protein